MHFLAPQQFWWMFALLGGAAAWLAWGRQNQMLRGWYGYGSPGDCLAPGGIDNRARYSFKLSGARYVIKALAVLLAVAAAVVALARPAIHDSHVSFPAGTVDIVVLLDVSRSMAAQDCNGSTSRLSTARSIIADKILPALNHNRIGIICYAGKADPKLFLTYKLESARWLVENELTIASAPGDGSAMSDAFDLAFKYFDEDSEARRSKMIVMLSDGGTDRNTNLSAIATGCKKRGVYLVAVGLGTPTLAMIPVSELSEEDRKYATGPFYKTYRESDGELIEEVAKTGLELPTFLDLVSKCQPRVGFVQVTSPEGFHFKPLASDLNPQEQVGEKEVFFYPTLLFFLAVCLSVLATAAPMPRKTTAAICQAVAYLLKGKKP